MRFAIPLINNDAPIERDHVHSWACESSCNFCEESGCLDQTHVHRIGDSMDQIALCDGCEQRRLNGEEDVA